VVKLGGMMQTGKNKIREICDTLKKEALLPAQEEAEEVIFKAKTRAENIVKEAHLEAEDIIAKAKNKIAQERNVFESALLQASKQAVQSLRQEIEHNLFDGGLERLVAKGMQDPGVLAKLVEAMVQAIKKEGMSVDFSVLIPSTVPSKDLTAFLAKDILESLKEKDVLIGKFDGGIRLHLHDKKMTLDLSDIALKDLLSNYLRKDFREIVFKT
jgi:V/A-type H+/Na+-transporting ATPase subunit E